MSKHSVFCTILKQISDDHRCPEEPFAAQADSKQIIEKARKLTRRELLRNAPVSPGAKLLIAATGLCGERNRNLGILMHCCEAWDPVGQCFDDTSFQCTNFHGRSHIVTSLARENIAEREAVQNLPGLKLKFDNALAKCRLSLRSCISKKPMICLHAVTDEEGRLLEDEDESCTRLRTDGVTLLSHVSMTNDTTHMRPFSILCKKPRKIPNGLSKSKILTMCQQPRKNPLLALMESPVACTGVLVGWAPTSSLRRLDLWWKVARSFLPVSQQAGPYLFPNLLLSTTTGK